MSQDSNTIVELRTMARQLAEGSIVTKALGQYIYQILGAVNDDTIQPLRDEIERLRGALYAIIDLDHHNMGSESKATRLARAALQENADG